MSIALYRDCGGGGGGGGRIARSPGFVPFYDHEMTISGAFGENNRRFGGLEEESSSSSSIGRNSDLSDGRGGEGGVEEEVESVLKGPLDTMDALEDVLPIKRGISKFYNGKSKSFTSLSEASSVSSIKELAKPENAYTRKRKNLLLSSRSWDKDCSFSSRLDAGGFSKRQTNSSRSTVSFAMALSSADSSNTSGSPNSASSSPSRSRPPLHPQSKSSLNGEPLSSSPQRKFSPWRSFSLSDLQHIAGSHHIGDDPEKCGGELGNRPD
ncbi:OXIDATIVE STRESS 3 LIKE 1-like protein [Drosera capensis]